MRDIIYCLFFFSSLIDRSYFLQCILALGGGYLVWSSHILGIVSLTCSTHSYLDFMFVQMTDQKLTKKEEGKISDLPI